MKINVYFVKEAIKELESIVAGGRPSSDGAPGARPEGARNSYFVVAETAIISLKSVARLAYARSGIIWDRPASKNFSYLLQEFGITVLHDNNLREGPREDFQDAPGLSRTRTVEAEVRLQQGPFRAALLELSSCCMLSGCRSIVVLEACHIVPFAKDGADHVDNGLLLRSDLHKLFDRGFLAVNPETRMWVFADRVQEDYDELRDIEMPEDVFRPRQHALQQRWFASEMGTRLD